MLPLACLRSEVEVVLNLSPRPGQGTGALRRHCLEGESGPASKAYGPCLCVTIEEGQNHLCHRAAMPAGSWKLCWKRPTRTHLGPGFLDSGQMCARSKTMAKVQSEAGATVKMPYFQHAPQASQQHPHLSPVFSALQTLSTPKLRAYQSEGL